MGNWSTLKKLLWLKRATGNDLPAGYQRLASIDFDGSTYYNTNEYLYGSDVVKMTVTGTSSTGENLFGAYSGTSSGQKNFSLFIYGGGSSNNCYFRYGEELVRPRYGSGQKTITFGAGGTTGFASNVTTPETEFTSTAVAYIGALPNSTSAKFSGTIVGDIFVSNRLKYIPCKRESDGVIGYYEAKNGNFLEPQG